MSRLMLVANGQGIPLSLHVDRAWPNERKLVEVTLARLRIPQRRGCTRTRPLVLVTDRNFDGKNCVSSYVSAAFILVFPDNASRTVKFLDAVVRSNFSPGMPSARKLSGPVLGCLIVAV